MKRTLFFGSCAFVFLFFVNTVFASSGIFPGVFESRTQGKQNCSVASDNIAGFCKAFKTAVQSCSPLGPLPMQTIYNLMLGEFGDLNTACTANAGTYGGTVAACVAQWNCYWNGGASGDMTGLCDGDGKKCESL